MVGVMKAHCCYKNVKIYDLCLAFSQSTLRESTHEQFQDLKRTFEYVFTKLGLFVSLPRFRGNLRPLNRILTILLEMGTTAVSIIMG